MKSIRLYASENGVVYNRGKILDGVLATPEEFAKLVSIILSSAKNQEAVDRVKRVPDDQVLNFPDIIQFNRLEANINWVRLVRDSIKHGYRKAMLFSSPTLVNGVSVGLDFNVALEIDPHATIDWGLFILITWEE